MANLAWRAQPPDEASGETGATEEQDAEVVDLTHQRLLGWLKGMFGTDSHQPPRDDG